MTAAGQLALIGLKPADIQWLVMPHTDIDHVGGIADFPQAVMVIGQAERALDSLRYFADRSPVPWPADVTYQLIREDTDLCPGVTLFPAPGHAPGQLSLLIRLPRTGAVLLTGDPVSRPAEIDEGFPTAWNPPLALESAKRIMDIARSEEAMIIYGHNPEQWNTLKKVPTPVTIAIRSIGFLYINHSNGQGVSFLIYCPSWKSEKK